ncbi:MAG: transcription elongation factor GreA [Chitinophagales bacterium]|nr:transcription elongation factor GreA [Chitinophagales bacterium]
MTIYLTKEGYENLKNEVHHLKTVERKAAAAAIAEAREKGDLSENAEYDAAKEAQGILEKKIAELAEMFMNAKIIDESEIDISKVSILTTVKVMNLKVKKEYTYTLVSEKEADLKAGKISVTSPIGKGLLGKKLGEKAKVMTPGGEIEFDILSISL